MFGKIYYLPKYPLFYKSYNGIILNQLRKKIIFNYNKKIENQMKMKIYIEENIQPKIIYEWSSFTSDTSSDTTSSFDSDWVDMKKLL